MKLSDNTEVQSLIEERAGLLGKLKALDQSPPGPRYGEISSGYFEDSNHSRGAKFEPYRGNEARSTRIVLGMINATKELVATEIGDIERRLTELDVEVEA